MPATLSHRYGWNNAVAPQSCGIVGAAVLQALRDLGARRVLDLGAGNGALCAQMHAAGFEVVGVERDAEGVQIARTSHPSIPFHCFGIGDDATLLITSIGKFDVVVSTEVIEHLYSPHELPLCAQRFLAPGGHLLLTTPYHGYVKNLALSIFGHWDVHHAPLWHGGHIKFWSRRTLTQLLAEGGFRAVAFRGIGRLPFLWKSMLLTARLLTESRADALPGN